MKASQRLGALVRGFGKFWWDFIVGEDLTIALGVCIGLAGVYALHIEKVSSWWILPVLWITALATSLARAVRKAS